MMHTSSSRAALNEAWSSVLLSSAPAAVPAAEITLADISSVQRAVFARSSGDDELEKVLRAVNNNPEGSRKRSGGRQTQSEVDLEVGSCQKQRLPVVLQTLENRHEMAQRIAWDFRSLDSGSVGRLPLHRCVLLFANNLGGKFTKQVWKAFRDQQEHRRLELGDFGGACLEDVRTAVLDAAMAKSTDVGINSAELVALIEYELNELQGRCMHEYKALSEAMRDQDADAEKRERAARGRELREAAQRRMEQFRKIAMTVPEEDNDIDEALAGDVPDGTLGQSFTSVSMDASHMSLVSAVSGVSSDSATAALAREKRKQQTAQSVWETLEAKYDMLSLKLLVSTMPVGKMSQIDVDQLHGAVMRLLRAGRLDEAEKLLGRHSNTEDVVMLLGSADGKPLTILADGADFSRLSTTNRAIAELHLRQSKERDVLGNAIREKGGRLSAAAAMRRLRLQMAVGEAERSFAAAALVVGLHERAHRPDTLDRLHPDSVRSHQLARSRLPALLNTADLFKDFTVLAKRLRSDTLLPSGESGETDKEQVERSVLQLLLHRHQTEQSALVWLLEHGGAAEETTGVPMDGSLPDVVDELTSVLSRLSESRDQWKDSKSMDESDRSILEHQELLAAAAALVKQNSWRWCHGTDLALSPLPRSSPHETAIAGDGGSGVPESGSRNGSGALLIELLSRLQEIQLGEIQSVTAETDRKNVEELRELVAQLHQSLVGLHLDNVASVLLRGPVNEEQWKHSMNKFSIQVKFRSLQDVFLHEALALGDGSAAGQKEWNALALEAKQAEVASLRLEERSIRSERVASEMRKVDKTVVQSARASVSQYAAGSSHSDQRTVPLLLEDMCRRALANLTVELQPVDSLNPLALRALILGAPSFEDAAKLACSGGELWMPSSKSLSWQIGYLGKQCLDVMDVKPYPQNINALLGSGPAAVVADSISGHTLRTLQCCQAHERQALAMLLGTVLRLTSVWREVATMEAAELRRRLEELKSSMLVYWRQDNRSGPLLAKQYSHIVQEMLITHLQIIQEEEEEEKEENGSGSGKKDSVAQTFSGPALQLSRAVAMLWKRCYALQSDEMRQVTEWLNRYSSNLDAGGMLLRHMQEKFSRIQTDGNDSRLDIAHQLLLGASADHALAQACPGPLSTMLRAHGCCIEPTGVSLLLSAVVPSAEAASALVAAVDTYPERKVKSLRHQFLLLVTKEHQQTRCNSMSTLPPDPASIGTSVLDAAEELCILEQSLDAVDHTDTNALADILALHPGGEDTFQELCWLMAEVGLMPALTEKAGEMDKTAAAVSVIQTLGKLSERRTKQMQKWTAGLGVKTNSDESLATLQAALSYQMFVLDGLDNDDINTALLLVMTKSMMSLKMPRGHTAPVTYSSDWYYHSQLLAQRYVQIWQARKWLAMTYEAELTALIEREQDMVKRFVTEPASKARCCVASRVTLVHELLTSNHQLQQLQNQILLLLLQLCDLDRPGLAELTEQPADVLATELDRLGEQYEQWVQDHADASQEWIQQVLKAGCNGDTVPTTESDVSDGLSILHEAATVRVVLTMWQLEARESGDSNAEAPEEQEPMAILLLRQLVCHHQQAEDQQLRDVVAMDSDALRTRLLESFADRMFCHWRSLAGVLFSGDDFSKSAFHGTAAEASANSRGGVGQFNPEVRLYRLSTVDLYGQLDTRLQERMKRKNKKVKRRRSRGSVGAVLKEEPAAEAEEPVKAAATSAAMAGSSTERSKDFEDKHRMMMSDLLTTYNKMREERLELQKPDRNVGSVKRLRFSTSKTDVLRHAGAEAAADTEKTKTPRKRLKSSTVADRLEKRKRSRQQSRTSVSQSVADASDESARAPASSASTGDTEAPLAILEEDNEAVDGELSENEDDDVLLPDVPNDEGGDSLEDSDESEQGEDQFRPLTAWASGRPKTASLARPATSSGRPMSAARPLTSMEETELNRGGDSSSSVESAVAAGASAAVSTGEGGDAAGRNTEETDTRPDSSESTAAKQQLLREKSTLDMADPSLCYREPAKRQIVRTNTMTVVFAGQEKDRQKEEALNRRKQRLASKVGGEGRDSLTPDQIDLAGLTGHSSSGNDPATRQRSSTSPASLPMPVRSQTGSPRHSRPSLAPSSPVSPRHSAVSHSPQPHQEDVFFTSDPGAGEVTGSVAGVVAAHGTLESRRQSEKGRQKKHIHSRTGLASGPTSPR